MKYKHRARCGSCIEMMGQSSVKGELGKGEKGIQTFPSSSLFSLKKKPTKIKRVESLDSPNQRFFSRARWPHLESKMEKKWPSPALVSLTNHKQLFAYHSNASELLPLHKAFPASFQLQTQIAAIQKTGELWLLPIHWKKKFGARTFNTKGKVPEVYNTTRGVNELSSLSTISQWWTCYIWCFMAPSEIHLHYILLMPNGPTILKGSAECYRLVYLLLNGICI